MNDILSQYRCVEIWEVHVETVNKGKEGKTFRMIAVCTQA